MYCQQAGSFHKKTVELKSSFFRADIVATVPYPATVTVEESVSGMLKQLADGKLTKDGRVICHDGQLLPW